MINYELIQCKDFSLCNIETSEFLEFNIPKSKYIRVKMPALYENQKNMKQDNYIWVDRMLLASINLKRDKLDYKKMVRLDVRKIDNEIKDYISEIKKIAYKSFPTDRRFHITENYNNDIAQQLIDCYIDKIQVWLICFFKDLPIGFIGLIEKNADEIEIYLAAIDERYRSLGAANSLYAYACAYSKEKKYKKIYGYISTVNMSVMNLYSFLGATFSHPEDVYIK